MLQVRLGRGIVTCAAVQGTSALAGCSTGSLFSVLLHDGRDGRPLPPGSWRCEGLVPGCEELEEEEEGEAEEEEDVDIEESDETSEEYS